MLMVHHIEKYILTYLLDGFINTLWVEDQADSQQMVHLLRLLINLIVLVGTGREQLLGTLHVQQSGRQRADSVGIAAHHHVCEAYVVGC